MHYYLNDACKRFGRSLMNAPHAVNTLNPMGTRGFEFVAFTGPDFAALDGVMRALGFTAIAMHRSKNVTLYRQGGINFIVNGEGKGFAKEFGDTHGPSVC